MEKYQARVGRSDEEMMYWSLSSSADDEWSCSSSPVKSFNCAFCKKGFSTAQGLGGHMNIHRKDRAKLRQLQISHQNLLSLSSNPPHKNPFPLEQVTCIPKSPNSLSIQDDTITSATKDFLFCSSPKKQNFPDKDDDDADSESQPSSRSIQTELDLELRLGPEPNEISSSTRNREFF